MSGWRISTDQADMQLDVIHGYLVQSYWSPGIPRETVARAIEHSICAGVFAADGRQHGFARVITDQATFAYLADVFVLDSARGQGLASRMLAALDALPALAGLRRWLLATRDAHALYRAHGWESVPDPAILMQRVVPDIYRRAGA
jgi:GNAT superfamily N-acetyltransferase